MSRGTRVCVILQKFLAPQHLGSLLPPQHTNRLFACTLTSAEPARFRVPGWETLALVAMDNQLNVEASTNCTSLVISINTGPGRPCLRSKMLLIRLLAVHSSKPENYVLVHAKRRPQSTSTS